MNADGSNRRRLTSRTSNADGPAWSPDSTRIAFSSVRSSGASLYHVAATGGRAVRLTTGAGPDLEPAWQPARSDRRRRQQAGPRPRAVGRDARRAASSACCCGRSRASSGVDRHRRGAARADLLAAGRTHGAPRPPDQDGELAAAARRAAAHAASGGPTLDSMRCSRSSAPRRGVGAHGPPASGARPASSAGASSSRSSSGSCCRWRRPPAKPASPKRRSNRKASAMHHLNRMIAVLTRRGRRLPASAPAASPRRAPPGRSRPAATSDSRERELPGARDAVALVKSKGYTPDDTRQYKPWAKLRVLVATATGSASGNNKRAFFFVGRRYIGTATDDARGYLDYVGQTSTRVRFASACTARARRTAARRARSRALPVERQAPRPARPHPMTLRTGAHDSRLRQPRRAGYG